MKINIGDTVRFLNDVGEGVVTKIVNKNIVHVLIEDGFELPTQIEELVVVKQFETKKKKADNIIIETKNKEELKTVIAEEEIEEFDGNDSPVVFFAFAPENPDDVLGSKINLYLINDCNYILMYTIGSYISEKYQYFNHGSINPNTKIQIKSIPFEQLNKIDSFYVNLIFYKKGTYEPVRPVENKLKVQAKKFTKEGCFEVNDFLDEKALIYCVTSNIEEKLEMLNSDEIKEIISEKNSSEIDQKLAAERYKARPEPITIEVDLHINNLLVDCRGMSNQEILEFQMKQFHLEMNKALKERANRIVFIHGIGNGTLKNEVRKELAENYTKYKFQDASFKEYGFGATLVILH